MLLRNLDPIHGLYNGTHLRLIRSTRRILECHILGRNGAPSYYPLISLYMRSTVLSGALGHYLRFHFRFPQHL